MEIGLPEFLQNLDIVGGIFWFIEKIPNVLGHLFNWLVETVGGNYIAAALIVGFMIYIPIDMFIYHRFLDRGAASLGDWIARIGGRIILFLVIGAGIYTMMAIS